MVSRFGHMRSEIPNKSLHITIAAKPFLQGLYPVGLRNILALPMIPSFAIGEVDHVPRRERFTSSRFLSLFQTLPSYHGLGHCETNVAEDISPFNSICLTKMNFWSTNSLRERRNLARLPMKISYWFTIAWTLKRENTSLLILRPWLGLKTKQSSISIQNSGSDCGVFAIAVAVTLALREDPLDQAYGPDNNMRKHLGQNIQTCILNWQILAFLQKFPG